MRTLFLFLVLLNLSYYAVGDLLAPPAPAKATSAVLPPGARKLTLVPAGAPRVAAGAGTRCYSLGPFSNRTDAQSMRASLGKLGVAASIRQMQQTRVTGYWVYLPPFASAASAAAAAQRLGEKGLHDYYVVTAQPDLNAVSLGLFRERRGAERRLARVVAMGFDPKLKVRTSPSDLYWVDYREEAAERVAPAVWQHSTAGGDAVQRLGRDCGAG